jgi:hypothetical protein
MKYGTLTQTHPAWDGGLWTLLDCLYEGGFAIASDPKQLAHMLPMHVNESSALHDERKKAATYINYLGDIVDFFAAQLFTKTLTVLPGEQGVDMTRYIEFAEDADGKGETLQQLMARCFITAALTSKAIVAVDFPRNVEPAASLLEEQATGADRPRAFWIDPRSLLDWKKDDRGRFEWAILRRFLVERDTPSDSRNILREQFKVWSMVDGFAAWETWEHKRKKGDDPPHENHELRLVDAGTTSFLRVPLLEFELPKGLWIGNKIGPQCLEHFRRRTTLVASQQKSLMAIPVLKLGPEIGAPRAPQPSEAQQDPSRGSNPKGQFDQKGWVRIGAGDDLSFAEPKGGAYEVEAKQLDRLVDEIFRVSHLMAQSVAATSQALSRSGQSKSEDRGATEVVLEALGDRIGKFAIRIYDTIAETLGDDIFWKAQGLSDFKLRDRALVVDEATKVGQIKIPSKTFKRNYLTQVALRLLEDTTTEDEQLIRTEIETEAEKPEPVPPVLAQFNQPPPTPPQLPPPPGNGMGGAENPPGPGAGYPKA